MRSMTLSKKAPFWKSSTELPGIALLSVRPASEGIRSSIGEAHSILSLGSRWFRIDQMTATSSTTTPEKITADNDGKCAEAQSFMGGPVAAMWLETGYRRGHIGKIGSNRPSDPGVGFGS